MGGVELILNVLYIVMLKRLGGSQVIANNGVVWAVCKMYESFDIPNGYLGVESKVHCAEFLDLCAV